MVTPMVERDEANAAPNFNNDDLARFFSLSLDMLCIAGFDGYFKHLNPVWRTTLGYTFEELFKAPFLSFVHPDDEASTIAAAGALADGKDVISFVNRYRRKDGTYCWLEWRSKSVPA